MIDINMNKKEEGLKKIKFYDRLLWVILISFILLIPFQISPKTYFLFSVALFVFQICAIIFSIGTFYNQVKKGDWTWFVLGLLSAGLLNIIYYFSILRKIFNGEEINEAYRYECKDCGRKFKTKKDGEEHICKKKK
jgi:hypothetical protein